MVRPRAARARRARLRGRERVRALVLDAPGRPPSSATSPIPSRARAGARRRARVRRVPDRPPHPRRRARPPRLPLVPGHQVVGRVAAVGDGVEGRAVGDPVGVPWLGWADGTCAFCASGARTCAREARFTGSTSTAGTRSGSSPTRGSASRSRRGSDPATVAPLLCAGAIGYRALRLAGDADRLGLYGFGNAARLITQVALHQGRRVYAFTRPGDAETQRLAVERGCAWAGDSTAPPPEPLDAAILFAAVGELVRSRSPRSRRAGRSCAPRSTCRTSRRSPTSSCGASASCARSRTSRGATARSSSRSPPRSRSGPTFDVPARGGRRRDRRGAIGRTGDARPHPVTIVRGLTAGLP